uniref:Fe2OG dioxygenase domain-containing protein n=3 Tax=Ditylum brightwellii TaxID=49249 RepID=A0A6U3UZ66_9STRA|mmetsp:Transcript_10046/g.14931  ORF Transcript_10046/g.14931 Transcript_10046/m.14931 type:complete len:568 (+) Transcript_10046:164-1867(+)
MTISNLLLLLMMMTSSSSTVEAARTKKSTTTTLNHLSNLDYLTFPDRKASEAAVVEWGHSAVISAIDATVASFGPQTSRGAFFEVEASPILADPVAGVSSDVMEKIQRHNNGEEYYKFEPAPLNNAEDVHGNMVVMTNTAGLSGVTMAKIAKESGAAALMVVNVDHDYPDYVYSLTPENEEEQIYAEEEVDIPVIMVSLQSGNVLTTATVDEHTDPKDIVNNGMPERIRLYGGGDRPFFEDVLNHKPVVYIIHNLLTETECDELIKAAESKFDLVSDDDTNYLEHTIPPPAKQDGVVMQNNIQRATLWRGALNPHSGKQIEERIEQVTGFPQDHFSDFQVNKHVAGSYHGVHYDTHPINVPMATITVFLNDVDEGDGGELVFPSPALGGDKKRGSSGTSSGGGKDDDPVKIYPRKGIAVVHHNTDEEYQFDASTLHAELPLKNGVKYVAKKFIYANPQPPSKRIVLPLIALPFGGKLPRCVCTFYQFFLEKFGMEEGNVYFDKFCTVAPVLCLFLIASVITNMVKTSLTDSSSSSSSKGKTKKESSEGKKKAAAEGKAVKKKKVKKT